MSVTATAERQPAPPEFRRQRPDWAGGRVRDDAGSALPFFLLFGAFWNLVSWTVFLLAWRDGALAREPRTWLIGLFPFIGLILAGVCLRLAWRRLRFGRSTLELRSAVPLATGGRLAADVSAGGALPAGPVRLRLTVLQRTTTGSGKNRRTHEEVLWQDEWMAQGHPQRRHDGKRTVVPVDRPLPAALPAATALRGEDGVVWRLEARAELPGADYEASFALPVLLAGADPGSGSDAGAVPAAVTGTADPGSLAVVPDPDYRPPADSPITVRRESAGLVVDFPPARNPGAARSLTGFWLLWTLVCLGIALSAAPLFFGIVFGAVDLLLLWAVLGVWRWHSRAVAREDGLEIRGGHFGLGAGRRLPAAEVGAIEIRRGMQAGTTAFFTISAVDARGRRHALGRDVRDRREAEWLAAALAAELRPAPPVRFTWARSRG